MIPIPTENKAKLFNGLNDFLQQYQKLKQEDHKPQSAQTTQSHTNVENPTKCLLSDKTNATYVLVL